MRWSVVCRSCLTCVLHLSGFGRRLSCQVFAAPQRMPWQLVRRQASVCHGCFTCRSSVWLTPFLAASEASCGSGSVSCGFLLASVNVNCSAQGHKTRIQSRASHTQNHVLESYPEPYLRFIPPIPTSRHGHPYVYVCVGFRYAFACVCVCDCV